MALSVGVAGNTYAGNAWRLGRVDAIQTSPPPRGRRGRVADLLLGYFAFFYIGMLTAGLILGQWRER